MILNDIAWFWSHRLPLAKAIQKEGYDLHLATAGASDERKLHDMNVAGHDLPEHDSSLNPFKQIAILWSIYKTIKHVQPDVIHAITIRYAFYTGIVTKLIGYKPVIYTIAGLGSLFEGKSLKAKILQFFVLPLFRFAFRRDKVFIIFQNPDDQDAMVKTRTVFEDQTTIIRGSGVDLTEFSFTPEEVQDVPVILFCSRLIKEKGLYELVEAARILRAKGLQFELQVAGNFYPKNPGSIPPEQIEEWVEAGDINWLGQVDNMPEIYKRTAVICLPSYYREGVPKVLLEAMATGRPLITTDLPGCRETVQDGVNGYLIPGREVQPLADALEKLITDPEKRAKFGAESRKLVEKDFHVESVVQRTLNIYTKLR